MYSNTTGSFNVAVGYNTLQSNTIGTANVAIGAGVAFVNQAALYANTTGNYNIAIGSGALAANTTGVANTAVGHRALQANTIGTPNDAFGYQALYSNTTGTSSTAIGFSALYSNATGTSNVAVGAYTLYTNNGTSNTGVGQGAGYSVSSGTFNTLLGYQAGFSGTALTTGGFNVVVGADARTSSAGAVGQIVIGHGGVGNGDNVVTIGRGGTNYISNGFTVNATWTKASDERIKKNIIDLDIGLDFVKELKIKSYNWKPSNEIPEDIIGYSEENTQDTTTTMYGMLAQDVKAAMDKHGYEHFGGWSSRESDGLQGLSNEMFVLPLINAVKELSAKVEALEAKLAETTPAV